MTMITTTTEPSKAYDGDLIAAFKLREDFQRKYLDLPVNMEAEAFAGETQLQNAVDLAEGFAALALARTPRGVEIQLWTALSHMVDDPEQDWRTYSGDLEFFSGRANELDWPAKLVLAAIKSLRAMQAT